MSLTGADVHWQEKTVEFPPEMATNVYLRLFCLQDGLAIRQCRMKLEQSAEQEIAKRLQSL